MKMTDEYDDAHRGFHLTGEWDGASGRPSYTVALYPVMGRVMDSPSLDAEGAAYLAERLTDFVARFEASAKAIMMLRRG